MANLLTVVRRKTTLSYPVFHPDRPGDLPVLLSPDDFARAFPAESEFIEGLLQIGARDWVGDP